MRDPAPATAMRHVSNAILTSRPKREGHVDGGFEFAHDLARARHLAHILDDV